MQKALLTRCIGRPSFLVAFDPQAAWWYSISPANSCLAHELVYIIAAEPYFGIVFPAHIDLGEDILKAGVLPLFIYVIHTPGNVEEGNHLFDILVHKERVGLPGRFKDVVVSACGPVVLEITPRAFEHVAVNGSGMT